MKTIMINKALKRLWTIMALYFMFGGILMGSAMVGSCNPIVEKNIKETPTIKLSSNSFNAQKRSSFTINGKKEQIRRGLTIIHFNTSDEFEFMTFDTHESEEASEQLVQVLEKLRNNNAVFAMLAHDSAAKSLMKQKAKLANMGFVQLSLLKTRQAYAMHNINGKIVEQVSDTSVSLTSALPKNIVDSASYFPKITYDFEPSNDRYIAHAGGEVDGHKSTNSKAALDQNYKKGFRLFELDIIETSDGHLVAAHDWNMWSRFTDYKGTLPPTLAEFKKENIYGDYETLDMEGINKWFAEHPDATLVTDKVNDPIAFADAFVDKDRLIMELFSVMAVEKATQHGINAMISHKPFFGIKGDKLNFLKVNNVKYAAISRRAIEKNKDLMLELKKHGIKVYVYHVNFDEGKDEKYVQENEIGIVYGMYADKWAFDLPPKKLSK
ncbi:interleukin-like EMT inducer domain-containing protein [Maribacter algicola]|uniref:Interleukin-like EMT inducer domain-containing protein n=1 Tax=Meishania litoralis TaxID=3434685 RepID=A0ACC7LLC1_9FLAO